VDYGLTPERKRCLRWCNEWISIVVVDDVGGVPAPPTNDKGGIPTPPTNDKSGFPTPLSDDRSGFPSPLVDSGSGFTGISLGVLDVVGVDIEVVEACFHSTWVYLMLKKGHYQDYIVALGGGGKNRVEEKWKEG
jgi:hypothetical protein